MGKGQFEIPFPKISTKVYFVNKVRAQSYLSTSLCHTAEHHWWEGLCCATDAELRSTT